MAGNQILLVDDDDLLCGMLSEYLSNEGFVLSSCHNGSDALALINKQSFDLIVLDIMMPGLSGLEVLQNLRPHNQCPVIMLTGRGDDLDRIIGLEMGADDYLAKPCNPRELLARVNAVLRRSKSSSSEYKDSVLKSHGLVLNSSNRQVMVDGVLLELTSAEFNVLQTLMQAQGEIVSREYLTEQVLHRKLSRYDRSIDVHISRVRQKLQQAGKDETLIKSIRGAGYIWLNSEGDRNA